MDDSLPRERFHNTTDQVLQLILARLDSFPAERLVRIETELQQLKGLLEEECRSRKDLGGDLQRMAREFGDTMDKRIDRAFSDCRQDRDLRLSHLTERLADIEQEGRESRSAGTRMKIAVFSAIAAFVISIINAMISLLGSG